jgi:hypothetical protein
VAKDKSCGDAHFTSDRRVRQAWDAMGCDAARFLLSVNDAKDAIGVIRNRLDMTIGGGVDCLPFAFILPLSTTGDSSPHFTAHNSPIDKAVRSSHAHSAFSGLERPSFAHVIFGTRYKYIGLSNAIRVSGRIGEAVAVTYGRSHLGSMETCPTELLVSSASCLSNQLDFIGLRVVVL